MHAARRKPVGEAVPPTTSPVGPKSSARPGRVPGGDPQRWRLTGTTAPPPHPAAQTIRQRIADELGVRPHQVAAAVDLLDGGATVPFIARYRKEATGGLDDAQLRTLEERLGYLRELEDRRAAILEAIDEQGKLDAALGRASGGRAKARLEDIYLPFKPKRRTKAQIARERGLEPLADALLGDPSTTRGAAATMSTEQGVADAAAALDGARAILVERFAEDADLVGGLRERDVDARPARLHGPRRQGDRGRQVRRLLRLRRAAHQAALAPHPGDVPRREGGGSRRRSSRRRPAERGRRRAASTADRVAASASPTRAAPADRWLLDTVRSAWRTSILLHLAIDMRMRLRTAAEDEARSTSSRPTCASCCSPRPAGGRVTIGLDPGFRTGVKVAVVDGTGKVVATDTIYPHQPAPLGRGLASLAELAVAHDVELIAIGNGTASRETEPLARELVARNPARARRSWCREAGRLGLLGLGARRRPSCPISTSRCAARCPSRGACRIRSPNW